MYHTDLWIYRYKLPARITEVPLCDGDETLLGGHISIMPWTSWRPPILDGLRMNPPWTRGETPVDKMWPRQLDDTAKQRVRSWVQEQAAKRDRTTMADATDVNDYYG